jgi:hypothetical protein
MRREPYPLALQSQLPLLLSDSNSLSLTLSLWTIPHSVEIQEIALPLRGIIPFQGIQKSSEI